MRYEIAYQPSYSLAIVNLEPGEEIRCESGAMVSMSSDLILEAKLNAGANKGGGFLGAALGAVKRSVLGGRWPLAVRVRRDRAPRSQSPGRVDRMHRRAACRGRGCAAIGRTAAPRLLVHTRAQRRQLTAWSDDE